MSSLYRPSSTGVWGLYGIAETVGRRWGDYRKVKVEHTEEVLRHRAPRAVWIAGDFLLLHLLAAVLCRDIPIGPILVDVPVRIRVHPPVCFVSKQPGKHHPPRRTEGKQPNCYMMVIQSQQQRQGFSPSLAIAAVIVVPSLSLSSLFSSALAFFFRQQKQHYIGFFFLFLYALLLPHDDDDDDVALYIMYIV